MRPSILEGEKKTVMHVMRAVDDEQTTTAARAPHDRKIAVDDRAICSCIGLSAGSLLLLLLASQTAYANNSEWKQRRTEHGHPDLQGTWDFGTKTPFQRPAALGERRAYTEEEAIAFESKLRERNRQIEAPVDLSKDAPVAGAKIGQEADAGSVDRRHDLTRVDGEFRTSIIIDPVTGQLPKRKEFLDHVAQFAASGIRATDGPETLHIATRCIHPLLVPSILPMPYSTLLQVVQTKDHVVLHTELIHDARVVRLNGTHSKHGGKIWMGDSIGRFEGDTLIVHTINFRPEQSDPEMAMSEDLELTERFTRVGQDEIVYSFTVVDPKAYTSPFTGERTLKRASPHTRLLEFACHEGNYSMPGILAGARKEEEDAVRQGKPASE